MSARPMSARLELDRVQRLIARPLGAEPRAIQRHRRPPHRSAPGAGSSHPAHAGALAHPGDRDVRKERPRLRHVPATDSSARDRAPARAPSAPSRSSSSTASTRGRRGGSHIGSPSTSSAAGAAPTAPHAAGDRLDLVDPAPAKEAERHVERLGRHEPQPSAVAQDPRAPVEQRARDRAPAARARRTAAPARAPRSRRPSR